ncbi:non-ribosomal peptide synthetase, partial [Nocardia flavorosea]
MTRTARTRPTRARRPRFTSLPQLMATAVETNPTGIAVRYVDATDSLGELTYAELDERSSRLARLLIARGIGPEDLVAIAIPRSIDSVVTVWAVAKTGAGYVPVDVNHPADRIAHMVTDSGVVFGLSVAESVAGLPQQVEWLAVDCPETATALAQYPADPVSFDERLRPLRAEHPAYVIYTSGSTGTPKGVVVTQAGLAGFCAEECERFAMDTTARLLHFASPSFDISVNEMLIALGAAATLVVVSPTVYGGDELAAPLRRERVTHIILTPSALSSIDPAGLDDVRVVVVGGEACPAELVRRWAGTLVDGRPRKFFNGYGPTETTILVNISEPLKPGEPVDIGAPVRNVTEYVLDEQLRPLPTGVTGELYVAGIQLARGYHNRPALTADRFVANPFDGGGTRLYRTGDLVRWRADGSMDYLGRNDFQVKIRGFRIELGEIDAVLAGHESVNFAVTIGHEPPSGATVLVSYVHAAAGAVIDIDELLALAESRLPAYMVPASITVLDEVPLNPVGKLDRRALPEPHLGTTEYREPQTWLEKQVAAVFTELLHPVDPVGADDNFFDLGGNSLIATQAVGRLGALVDARVPARALFEASTVARLAERLAELSGTGDGHRALTPQARPELVPLSYAQQRMWFLNQYDTSSAAYNLPMAIRLSGALDVMALRAALGDVVARHESLRTRYPEQGGRPVQVILPADQVDLDLVPVSVSADELTEKVVEVAAAGFDVAAAVPVRARLFAVDPEEFVLVVVVHHIAGDGFSMAPLARDLVTAYAARAQGEMPGWEPLSVQYADFALWQREVLGREDDPDSLMARQIAFWQRTLAELPDELVLPTDRPRPAVASMAGATVRGELGSELVENLSALARARGASMFMVLHAGLAALLARLSGSGDIAIGTPIAGRGEQALDDLVGMFVNTLVLRTEVESGETFTDLLERAKQADLDAFAHADVPFERLVDLLAPERSQARNPLFQVALSLQNNEQPVLDLAGLEVSGVDLADDVARFDLQFTLAENGSGGMVLVLNYATELFDEATVRTMITRFQRLLSAAVADPDAVLGDLKLLDSGERRELLSRTGGPAVPARTLPELLAAAVAVDPAAPAVVFDGVRHSYGEFDERSNRLARVLIGRGSGAEDVVAVAVPRSADSVLAEWAVTKSGAAFLPIDPTYPEDRIAHMLTDSGAPVGITVASEVAGLPDSVDWLVLDELDLDDYSDAALTNADRVRPLTSANAAYVIYTSGSTGLPKGVVVSHAGLANFSAEQVERYGLTPASRALAFASPSFDASILELLLAVGSAGALVVVPTGTYGGAELGELISREQVTVGLITPSVLASLDPADIAGMEVIIAGGEAISSELVAKWSVALGDVDRRLHNAYGPTEATIATNISGVLHPGDRVTIGAPVRGMRALVLDARLNPVPEGVAGELYVGGIQLARGYHARPGLTAGRFVADPHGTPGSRLYRTGDVVRWRRDAAGDPAVEYVGRNDFQVKVRGFRIELGEIDAALTAHD